MLTGRIASSAVSLIVGIFMARYLGPKQFGSLSYAISFVGIFTPMASLGASEVLVRELAKGTHRATELLGTAWLLRILWAVSALVIIFPLAFLLKTGEREVLLIALVSAGLLPSTLTVIQSYFQARVEADRAVKAQIAQLILSSVIKLCLIVFHARLVWFALAAGMDQINLGFGLLVIYKLRSPDNGVWKVSKNLLGPLFRDSWPLMLTGLTVAAYMRVDQIMVDHILGGRQLGYYAAAVRLSEGWYFIPIAVANSVFPALVKAKERDHRIYYQRLQWLYDLMVWSAIAVALPVSLLAPKISIMLYGKAYEATGGVLAIHMWTAVFVFLGVATSKWLVAENYVRKSLYRALIGVGLNIILNWYLIPVWGIRGSATATLISQAAVNLGYDFMDRDMRYQLRLKLRAFVPIHLLKGSPL